MKKVVLTFVFSLCAAIACAFALGNNGAAANAVNDFAVTAERLSAADSAYTQAGDYKVSVSISNNSGFGTMGFGVYYDNANFAPIILDDDPYFTYGPASSGNLVAVEHDDTKGMYGTALMCWNGTTTNGVLLTYYLRPTASNNGDITPVTALVVNQVCNSEKEELVFTVSRYCEIIAPVQYVVGDANVSGGISIFDSTYIKRMVANANGTTITAANYQNYLLAHEVGDFVCSFEAVDINGDGVLTEADALIIESTLAGQGTSGNIYDGCSVYYVISTTNPTAA